MNHPNRPERAVVIGGSMAGLLAAAALVPHFDRVTVVERDRLPAGPESRKGVPQSHHLHVLMPGGQHAIEALLPDFGAELLAEGAVPVDEANMLFPAGWSRPFRPRSRHRLLSCSRLLVESVVRRRVIPQVNLRQGVEVTGLVVQHDRVRGVRLRPRGGGESLRDWSLAADLVVDASGRTSRGPEWLESLGLGRPAETRIDSFLGYASRQYALPPDSPIGQRAVMLMAKPPLEARTGYLFPIDGGRWIVTLAGAGRDYPPTDEAGFLEFARSLRDPVIHELIKDAEPLTPIRGHRRTENQRRHYERMRPSPDGLLVLGDAACAFNPVYGQGMSVAAQTAAALAGKLAGRAYGPGSTRAMQRLVVGCNSGAWLVATEQDLRYPTTEGARPGRQTRLMHRYLDRVLAAAIFDEPANAAWFDVMMLLQPPKSLFRPRVLVTALRGQRDGLVARPDLGSPSAEPPRMVTEAPR
jgi:2-polyprenyl-6-methoxyphenol hydroxylase-like FAD-dependent oxidoreductase